MTELVCWLARVLANVFGVVIVQSLYATWKEEEDVLKRLQNINMTSVQREPELPTSHFHNNAYAASIEHFGTIKRYLQKFVLPPTRPNLAYILPCSRSGSSPHIWSSTLPNNLATFQMNGLAYCTTTSEFNASIYVPNFPPPSRGFNFAAKRTQSLMDLRNLNEDDNEKQPTQRWDPWMTQSLTDAPVIPTYTLSLDRKLSPRGSKSMENLNFGSLRSRNSFFEQASHEYGLPIYYGPLHGPDFLVFKKQMSKNSLSNTSDDLQKYRDVALWTFSCVVIELFLLSFVKNKRFILLKITRRTVLHGNISDGFVRPCASRFRRPRPSTDRRGPRRRHRLGVLQVRHDNGRYRQHERA